MPADASTTLRLLCLAAVGALAGCGDSVEKFPPPCPATVINRDTGDLDRFRGPGRDLTDMVLQGRITSLNGACTRTDDHTVTTTLTVGLELTQGPAARSPNADVAYYIAVSLGDQIIDKQVYTVRAAFPNNSGRLRLSGSEVEIALPVSPTRTAAAFKIQVGFQLTPEELETNRRRAAR